MLPPQQQERLVAGARVLGVELTPDQVRRLGRYCSLLRTWNRRINLTRVIEVEEVVDRHFLDSLSLTPLLPPRTSLLDIGSGGGFPGAVLAVARPDLDVTLWEATAKKVAFLTALVADLRLTCRIEHRRSTPGARSPGTPTFESVVSRATMPLEQWITHGSCYVAPGGRLLAMQAHLPSALPDLPRFRQTAPHRYQLPSGELRWVVGWEREE